MNIKELTNIAKLAALAAGSEILKIYHSPDFGVELKGDNSPLTKADRAAHEVIVSLLNKSGIPILSEEGKNIPYEKRKTWEYFWMVDPLDGTKEFIKQNDEFTVNIALIYQGSPILGVVYAPVLEWLYWGSQDEGAWVQAKENDPLSLQSDGLKEVKRIVASRSHLSSETQEFIDRYPSAEVISMGSSLKFLLVAEGKAQVYPRFSPTMEWDTAAAHAIVCASGREVFDYFSGDPLKYNKEDLHNPWFICSDQQFFKL